MALFTVSTFGTFVGLLIAARKLALDPDPLKRAESLAHLATNGKALSAVLREGGLGPLAAEMRRKAEAAEAFTHDGPAKDDAKVLFWQVAPAAIADTGALAAADLDARAATDRMVATIKTSPHGPDFTRTILAEPYFRAVMQPTLAVMLARAEVVATLTPALWRETLRRHGVTIEIAEAIREDTEELLARVAALQEELAGMQQAQSARASGVSEKALLGLVRPIAEHVEDTAQALIELTRAVEIARKVQEEGQRGSNLGDFVDEVLRRTAALSAEGEHRAAIAELDAALACEESESRARRLRLLGRAIDEHVLARDPGGVADRIARRAEIEVPDRDARFLALLKEQDEWYVRGRDKGINFDLEVSIHIARRTNEIARTADERGAALNNLGTALRTLGEREPGTARLEEAVAAFRATLEETTRERVPLEWAKTQMNLGNALRTLGAREPGTARLEEAVAAYRAALKEWTRDRAPLDWAMTQMNLGAALTILGEREPGTARLEQAVAAFRATLEETTRERVPLEWAKTQMNLGNALRTLGAREPGTARLEEAVAAYRAALEEMTRDRVPLHWANTLGNQGSAMLALADRRDDLALAKRALNQLREGARVLREGGHVPWAETFEQQIPDAEALVGRLSNRR